MIRPMARERSTSVFLSEDLFDRAAALVPLLNADPEFIPVVHFTRHKVLRLAVAKGIAVLEEQYGKMKPKRKK